MNKWPGKLVKWTVLTILAAVIGMHAWKDPESVRLNNEVRANLPGSFIRLKDGVSWYELSGPPAGRPLVLLHGYAIDSSIWERNLATLESAGFRILRYDQFGRGFSDRPTRIHDQALFARQLLELLNALWISQPVELVCVSAGCVVAASFARMAPQRVRRITMIDPQMSAFSLDTWQRLPLAGELDALWNLDKMATSIKSSYSDAASRYEMQRKFSGHRRSMLNILRSQAGVDPMANYSELKTAGIAVNLIEGERDKGQPYREKFLEATAARTYIEIPGAAHGANYHAAEQVNAALLELLAAPVATTAIGGS